MDVKVEGYPDLRRRGAGVINTDRDAYLRALNRDKQGKRLDKIEEQMSDLSRRVDLLLKALGVGNETSVNQ